MSRPVLKNEQAKAAARRAGGGLVQRVTRWLAPVYDRYSKNLLTHGADYLRGEDEISIFSSTEGGLQDWRPLPGAGQTSLSHATLTTTKSGSMLLQGRYGGPVTAAQLLSGAALSEADRRRRGGVCGWAPRAGGRDPRSTTGSSCRCATTAGRTSWCCRPRRSTRSRSGCGAPTSRWAAARQAGGGSRPARAAGDARRAGRRGAARVQGAGDAAPPRPRR